MNIFIKILKSYDFLYIIGFYDFSDELQTNFNTMNTIKIADKRDKMRELKTDEN